MLKGMCALVATIALCLCLFGAEPGDLIYADKFDTQDSLAKNWTVKGGSLISKENSSVTMKAGGSLAPKIEIPEDFYLTVKMSMNEPADKEKPGFAGVIFNDGTKFLIRPDGVAWMIYYIKGDKRAQGGILKIEGFNFGKADEITVIREKLDEGIRYIYMVNGKPLKTAVAAAPEKYEPPMLWTYRETVTFSDYQISKLKK